MERIVVGTGRCGSTLLSNMLAKHPDGLGILEFLGAPDRTNAFNPGLIKPGDFQNLLMTDMPVPLLAMHRGMTSKEVLADIDFSADFKIPGICFVALPALSSNPQELLGEMLGFVGTLPTQTMAQHYLSVFAWLQKKYGKKFWIERTGSSIEFMPELFRTFPNAKYVHIHRDGPDASISMRNHFYFKLLVSFFTDPPTRAELEQTELAGSPIRPDDPISRRLGDKLPSLEQFGEYWNYQLQVGYQTFSKLAPSNYLEVAFEDLVGHPQREMGRIAEFFELPDHDGWMDEAAAMVSAEEVHSNVGGLSAAQQESILRTCQPGRILLGRYQHPWIHPTLKAIKEIQRAEAARKSSGVR